MSHIQIYSSNDGWSVQVLNDDGDRVLKSVWYDHNDDSYGVDGVKELLEYLGHTTYLEEVY